MSLADVKCPNTSTLAPTSTPFLVVLAVAEKDIAINFERNYFIFDQNIKEGRFKDNIIKELLIETSDISFNSYLKVLGFLCI